MLRAGAHHHSILREHDRWQRHAPRRHPAGCQRKDRGGVFIYTPSLHLACLFYHDLYHHIKCCRWRFSTRPLYQQQRIWQAASPSSAASLNPAGCLIHFREQLLHHLAYSSILTGVERLAGEQHRRRGALDAGRCAVVRPGEVQRPGCRGYCNLDWRMHGRARQPGQAQRSPAIHDTTVLCVHIANSGYM